jgi:hypothetical protein
MSASIADFMTAKPGFALITNLEMITEPAVQAVGSSEVFEYLRIDSGDTSNDAIINLAIDAATNAVQDYANVALITQRRRVTYGYGIIAELPYRPIDTIVSVEEGNEDGTWTATTAYTHAGSGFVNFDKVGTYRITYDCGFGNDYHLVPSQYRMGILRHIKEHYEYREGIVIGTSSSIIKGYTWKEIVQPKKRYTL